MNKILTLLLALAPLAVSAASPPRLSDDFTAADAWPRAAAAASGPVKVTFARKNVGSYDTVNSAAQSPALLLQADATGSKAWRASLRSGPLKVATGETELGKLTLAFDLSASAARPVVVTITSLDAEGKPTGALIGTVYPAAANFIHRHVLDLDAMQPAGFGGFAPEDPAIELTFSLASEAWPAGQHELRVDNVSFAGPTFYVSPTGSDAADGHTEKTALASPQAAIRAAQPGDIILLGAGTYRGDSATVTPGNNSGYAPTVNFLRAGTPAAWIVLKNYPGQHPVLSGYAWNIVSFQSGTKAEPDLTTNLAYLEVRGLHLRGESDTIPTKFPGSVGKPEGRSNSNGIAVDGRYMKNVPHHIRLADNLVEFVPAQGLGSLEGDWISIENNISRNNCWLTIYGSSGISVMGASNFDAADNIYKDLIRNNIVYRNETKQQWEEVKRISDGNGIILDVNQKTDARPEGSYRGRTLVIGNLAYDNGGGGVHLVQADRVDVINNTTYLNSASPALQYSQISTYSSKDVRIINNILVAPVADVAAGEKPEPVNKLSGPENKDVVFSHNLYFGGNIPATLGEGDQVGDPQFVKASRDPAVADFRLQPGSPALDAGTLNAPALPWLDLDGRPRPQGKGYDLGAYERPVHGVLFSTDFEQPLPAGKTAEGTIDRYQGHPGHALAGTGVETDLIPITNRESNLAKLSLGFDLWVETARPVNVKMESCDAAGQVTGSRIATVIPPVAKAFYRFNVDLDQTAAGEGKFDPLAPAIRFTFSAEATPLRIDNLSYTAPTFYVSPRGDDRASGTSEQAAFATLQHAVDAAQPGDVILIMDGTYASGPAQHLLTIDKAGRPDQWIVLRPGPGQHPVLTGSGWNIISLKTHSAYIELRGLTVRGERPKYTVEEALADTKSGKPADPKYNTNGIALDARRGVEGGGKAHHIRFIGNTISDTPGGGLSAIAGDYITVQGNDIFDTAHLMRYAGSGISIFRAWDFDANTGTKNFVIANRTHGNRCFIPWDVVNRVSDGNGIIIDDFINYQEGASQIPYRGRTLVQNNLSYGNGGSGIHAFASNHVDIVNNTAYQNAQSPELVWRQIYAGGQCTDVRVINNIIYAQRGRPLDYSVPRDSQDIVYAHNLAFGDGENDVKAGGGLGTGAAGSTAADQSGNLRADPQFVRPSLDPAQADFHVAPGSPAVDAGAATYGCEPIRDLDDRPRPQGPALDIGAYENPAKP